MIKIIILANGITFEASNNTGYDFKSTHEAIEAYEGILDELSIDPSTVLSVTFMNLGNTLNKES